MYDGKIDNEQLLFRLENRKHTLTNMKLSHEILYSLSVACNKKKQHQCEKYCIPNCLSNDNKFDCFDRSDETVPSSRRKCKIDSCTFSLSSLQQPETYFFKTKNYCDKSVCPDGFYLCKRENYCLAIDLVCDGTNQCPLGDDEMFCGKINIFFYILNY